MTTKKTTSPRTSPDLAERAVLGLMLRDPPCVAEVRALGLSPHEFYADAHVRVALAVYALADAGGDFDAVRVADELTRRGWLADLGGVGPAHAFLAELAGAFASPSQLAHHVGAVREAAQLRTLRRGVLALAEDARNEAVGLGELLDNAGRFAAERLGGPAADAAAEDVPVITRMADVQPERITWLWQGWLPDGCLCVLDGDPGLGKSSLTLDLAARLSTGEALPPLEGLDRGRGPQATLLLGAEDPLKFVVRPRLDAMGADVSLIHALEGFTCKDGSDRLVMLPGDLRRVAKFIEDNGVRLVVVDPLMAFLGSDTDAHKDQDVRRVLRPLSQLADKLRIVVLLVRHLNKLSGGPALYRGGSSIGITGAARASLICGRDPNEDRFVVAMNKLNVGPKPPSLAYRLQSAGMASRVVWDGEVELRPDQILGHGPPTGEPGQQRRKGRPPDALREARQFLADLLSGGPVETAEMKRRAKELLIADATLDRARADLGVEPYRDGKTYFVKLPPGHKHSDGAAAEPDAFPDLNDDETEG